MRCKNRAKRVLRSELLLLRKNVAVWKRGGSVKAVGFGVRGRLPLIISEKYIYILTFYKIHEIIFSYLVMEDYYD